MVLKSITIDIGSAQKELNLLGTTWRTRVPRRVMIAAKEELPAIIKECVPKRSGKLQRSAKTEMTEKGLRLWFDSPYAIHVDQGTELSPGRYVPAPLEKRLISTEITERRDAYKLALREGHSERAASAAWFTPIKRVPREKFEPYTAGEFQPFAKLGSGKRALRKGGTRYRVGGRISIREDLRGELKREVVQHELKHAIDWMAGEAYGAEAGARLERRAREFAEKRRNIGMHPGIKAANFGEKIILALIEELPDIIQRSKGVK